MATYTKLAADTWSMSNGTAFSGATLVGGDTILYEAAASHQSSTHYFNGYHGDSEANPITIDLNGNTIDVNGDNVGIGIENCSNILLINGTIHNVDQQGIYAVDNAWNITVQDFTVYDCGSIGIRIGRNTPPSTAPSNTWRANFQEDYSKIIDCTIYNTVSEGAYIGNSNAQTYYQNASNFLYQQCLITTAQVSGCTIYNTGADGIQIGSANGWASIFDNTVTNYATGNTSGHANGIQMGEGSQGAIYNNTVIGTSGTLGAMYAIQADGCRMYNNIGKGVGNGVLLLGSIFSPNRETNVYNNTFTDMTADGVYINNKGAQKAVNFDNNIFHHTTTPNDTTVKTFRIEGDGYWTPGDGNIFVSGASGLTALDFTDYDNNDFTLGGSSSATGAGTNVYEKDYLRNDRAGNPRPETGAWNSGAY